MASRHRASWLVGTLRPIGSGNFDAVSSTDARSPSAAENSAGRSHRVRFFVIGLFFALIQIVILALGWAAVEAIDTTRAYATGESFYSKAENAAVFRLYRYLRSGEEGDLQAFRAAIGATLGYRAARQELDKPDPDFAAAYAGYRRGGTDDADIPGAIRLYRWFSHWGPFEKAVMDWRQGDQLIDRLLLIADEVESERQRAPLDTPEQDRITRRIDTLNADLLAAERRFSDHIGAAARAATALVVTVLAVSSLLLWSISTGFAWSTYRKGIRAERQLRESEERLASRLTQAQKMEAIGRLTGGIAHDFNNLLGVIIGNLDLWRESTVHDSDADELVGEASDAALRGAELVRRLLAFARQQPLEPRRVDINGLISESIKLLRRVLRENIEIVLDLDSDVWTVVADPTQLETGLTNLATNARDAMPQGGRLIIGTQNCRLDDAYAEYHPDVVPGDYVMVSVTDNGAGIPAEILGRIFDPFFTTKAEGQGTGLGLSMVFGFVRQSGGHLNVYSEVGVGTTFRLYLPRVSETHQSEQRHEAEPLPLGRGETVLVVEDDPALRRLVVRQLSELGYVVREAGNADAALALLQGGAAIDLIFSDIMMPGEITGRELARIATERWPTIKVVLTSGFDQTKAEANDDGQTSVSRLNKPYRKVDLGRTLRQALDC
jgi:signal transduction histidine kinase